jgi:hypothetical protein
VTITMLSEPGMINAPGALALLVEHLQQRELLRPLGSLLNNTKLCYHLLEQLVFCCISKIAYEARTGAKNDLCLS